MPFSFFTTSLGELTFSQYQNLIPSSNTVNWYLKMTVFWSWIDRYIKFPLTSTAVISIRLKADFGEWFSAVNDTQLAFSVTPVQT